MFPVHIILSILVAFLKFLLGISTFILHIVLLLLVCGAVVCFVQKEIGRGIEALIIAFIFSPYGLPLIGASIMGVLEMIKER